MPIHSGGPILHVFTLYNYAQQHVSMGTHTPDSIVMLVVNSLRENPCCLATAKLRDWWECTFGLTTQ
jgi:hypothetical protein